MSNSNKLLLTMGEGNKERQFSNWGSIELISGSGKSTVDRRVIKSENKSKNIDMELSQLRKKLQEGNVTEQNNRR